MSDKTTNITVHRIWLENCACPIYQITTIKHFITDLLCRSKYNLTNFFIINWWKKSPNVWKSNGNIAFQIHRNHSRRILFITRKFVGVVLPLPICTQPKSVEIPVLKLWKASVRIGVIQDQRGIKCVQVLIIDSEKVRVRIQHGGFLWPIFNSPYAYIVLIAGIKGSYGLWLYYFHRH